MADLGLLFRP